VFYTKTTIAKTILVIGGDFLLKTVKTGGDMVKI
jgi:hypothetical protein